MSDYSLYLYLLLALVVGIFLIKRVASCVLRLVFAVVSVLILLAIYYLYVLPSAS